MNFIRKIIPLFTNIQYYYYFLLPTLLIGEIIRAGKANQLRQACRFPTPPPHVIFFSSPPVPASYANGSNVRLSFRYIFLRFILIF